MNNNVISQLAALKNMEAAELKDKWRELYASEPPPFNRAYLESRLAYRIQEIAHGGLKKETVKRIDILRDSVLRNAPLRKPEKDRPITGTVLVREFRGIEHRVRVLDDGFEYNGKRYRSLSAVASFIAGVHWNGPMFFGLRRRA